MNVCNEELMVMFKAGVREAFDMLYERNREVIYRYARCSLKRREDAEEVVQDVFLRVARSAWNYKNQGKFKAWILRITTNQIRTKIKNMKGSGREVEYIPSLHEHTRASPSMDLEQNYFTRSLLSYGMSKLSEQQKLILIMKDVEGMKYKEIAETLGISSENARVILHRARKCVLNSISQQEINGNG